MRISEANYGKQKKQVYETNYREISLLWEIFRRWSIGLYARCDSMSLQSEWPSSRKHIQECIETEILYIGNENRNWWSCSAIQCGLFSKRKINLWKIELLHGPAIPNSWIYNLRKLSKPPTEVLAYSCLAIPNVRTWNKPSFFNRWMDKEIGLHMHNGILFRYKEEWKHTICRNIWVEMRLN